MWQLMAMGIFELILVSFSGFQPWYYKHPIAQLGFLHRMAATIPTVKIANQRYRRGIRRKYRKPHCGNRLPTHVNSNQLSASLTIKILRLMVDEMHSVVSILLKLVRVAHFHSFMTKLCNVAIPRIGIHPVNLPFE